MMPLNTHPYRMLMIWKGCTMPTVIPPATAGSTAPDDGVPQHSNMASGSAQLAQQYAASHRASLALARWRNGSPQQQSISAALPAHQARWHARLQHGFIAWLEAGGFQQ
jgi:hypothetical protein